MTRKALSNESTFMLDRICIPVADELSGVEGFLGEELVSGIETIDSITRYVVRNGGKRVRPALMLLSARVSGAKSGPRQAAAIEMLHTASLLHDDVVDDAAVRRGLPSARARCGTQVSVLVGDFLLSRASRIFVEEGNQRIMRALSEAIGRTTEGELLEIAHQNDASTDAALYMRIIQGKTAALFDFAARAPAISAGLGTSLEESLGLFGFEVGQAFQLADDALDYVAEESRLGKASGTDLREGKLTYPLIVALERSSAEERASIRDALIAGKATREEFGRIRSIIDLHGGIEATLRLARELAERAKGRLSSFKPSIERDALAMLADYSAERGE